MLAPESSIQRRSFYSCRQSLITIPDRVHSEHVDADMPEKNAQKAEEPAGSSAKPSDKKKGDVEWELVSLEWSSIRTSMFKIRMHDLTACV